MTDTHPTDSYTECFDAARRREIPADRANLIIESLIDTIRALMPNAALGAAVRIGLGVLSLELDDIDAHQRLVLTTSGGRMEVRAVSEAQIDLLKVIAAVMLEQATPAERGAYDAKRAEYAVEALRKMGLLPANPSSELRAEAPKPAEEPEAPKVHGADDGREREPGDGVDDVP